MLTEFRIRIVLKYRVASALGQIRIGRDSLPQHRQAARVERRKRLRSTGCDATAERASRAFSSEVDTGSREENASKQESRAPFRFHRNGKSSSAARRPLAGM
ncbi:hypothetical protein DXU07_21020 [Bradyrhizobium elkanii]|nr:hypothetical protein [Bradyrhizobium elkanii]NWL71132.1 hypothetical protein [Bradyrhizobium elkanii]RYM30889.1 hypothetical protein EWH13_04745 [Bradyrhizobium elkanii]